MGIGLPSTTWRQLGAIVPQGMKQFVLRCKLIDHCKVHYDQRRHLSVEGYGAFVLSEKAGESLSDSHKAVLRKYYEG